MTGGGVSTTANRAAFSHGREPGTIRERHQEIPGTVGLGLVVRTVSCEPVHPSEQGIFALSTNKTGMIRQGCSDASSICEHFQRLTVFQLTFLLFAQTGAEFAITGMKSRQKGAAYGYNKEDGRGGLYDRRTTITLERRFSKY
jgi:hypothetical protein